MKISTSLKDLKDKIRGLEKKVGEYQEIWNLLNDKIKNISKQVIIILGMSSSLNIAMVDNVYAKGGHVSHISHHVSNINMSKIANLNTSTDSYQDILELSLSYDLRGLVKNEEVLNDIMLKAIKPLDDIAKDTYITYSSKDDRDYEGYIRQKLLDYMDSTKVSFEGLSVPSRSFFFSESFPEYDSKNYYVNDFLNKNFDKLVELTKKLVDLNFKKVEEDMDWDVYYKLGDKIVDKEAAEVFRWVLQENNLERYVLDKLLRDVIISLDTSDSKEEIKEKILDKFKESEFTEDCSEDDAKVILNVAVKESKILPKVLELYKNTGTKRYEELSKNFTEALKDLGVKFDNGVKLKSSSFKNKM